jgi:hypothetical protein
MEQLNAIEQRSQKEIVFNPSSEQKMDPHQKGI